MFHYSYLLYPFLLSLMLCALMVKSAGALGFIDRLDGRPQRFHRDPTPRSGGLGIFVSFALFGSICLYSTPGFAPFLCLILGGAVVFLSGIIEDFNGALSPKMRLFLQCFGALITLVASGIYLSDLGLGFSLPYALGLLFSIFAIVGVVNAINIIDGFNGLASGVALLVLAAIAFVAHGSGSAFVFYSALLYAGGMLGFFLLNFPRGRIFLGDGGAYFTGFVIAFLLICLTQNATLSNPFFKAILPHFPEFGEALVKGLIVATANTAPKPSAWFGVGVCIYPIFEVLFSIFRKRFVLKTHAMRPDSYHFHMLIFRILVKNNPKTAILIVLFNAPFVALATLFYQNLPALLALIFIFCILYVVLYRYLLSRAKSAAR